jgi:hypothetical protein
MRFEELRARLIEKYDAELERPIGKRLEPNATHHCSRRPPSTGDKLVR